MTEGREAEGPGDGSPPDRFVARSRPRTVHLDMAFTAVSVLILGLLILSGWSDRGIGQELLLFVGVPLVFGLQARQWRRLLAADVLLEIGPSGVRLHHVGHGWLVLPWEAVGSIGPDSMFRTVVVQWADGVDRSTPGTQWPDGRLGALRPRRWGFRVPLRFTDTKMHQVVAAVRHLRPEPAQGSPTP